MADRYPGYDVLAKASSLSFNAATRQVISERLATLAGTFFTADERRALTALCAAIVPQPEGRPVVPTAALVEEKVARDARDGWRDARLPPLQEAWRRGLAALDAEALAEAGEPLAALPRERREALLRRLQAGEAHSNAWGDMPCAVFFSDRVLADILGAYYAHPSAWSEIGFGGPAGPRGYVRMDPDRRDPWEAVEATGNDVPAVRRRNRHVR